MALLELLTLGLSPNHLGYPQGRVQDKELKLPTFRAHSPLLKSRRFLVDILTLLSSRCQLCPAARHLAVYLLDHFLDRYDITTSKQLYAVAVSCLLLASKFEDREDHVPKLEQINSTRILSSQNFSLTRKELLSTELLLLEAFGWNLCLPTPAHFLDYYLLASVSQKDHHCHSWPTTCPRKTKECLKEYAHYFLEVTLQGGANFKACPRFPTHIGARVRGQCTHITRSPPLCRDRQRKICRGKQRQSELAIMCKGLVACVQAACSLSVF
uniref:Cyclin J like n=1 Tax=Ovis aries TaxID=9940 RepID=A0AC11CT84_SHEEP